MKARRWPQIVLMIGWSGIAFPASANDCTAPSLDKFMLVREVEAQLRQSGFGEPLQLELEPISELPTMEQPTVRLLGHGLRSRVATELIGSKCGQARTATVWFKLRAFKEAWVYGQNTKAGKPLEPTQLRKERIDLAGAQLSPEELAEDIQELWLTQDVRAGMPVLIRHLQPEPLVKRDEVVRVIVHGPGLMVSTQGKAMRPGMLGENVPVLLEGSASSLTAVVAGKGEVHVGQ